MQRSIAFLHANVVKNIQISETFYYLPEWFEKPQRAQRAQRDTEIKSNGSLCPLWLIFFAVHNLWDCVLQVNATGRSIYLPWFISSGIYKKVSDFITFLTISYMLWNSGLFNRYIWCLERAALSRGRVVFCICLAPPSSDIIWLTRH